MPSAVEVWSPNYWITREFHNIYSRKQKVLEFHVVQRLRLQSPNAGDQV